MQEVFKKIIEKLEEYEYENLVEHDSEQLQHCKDAGDCTGMDCSLCVFNKAIEIVKQEAEQFGTDINVGCNGWIPCSERLPEGRQDVLVCFDNIDGCIIAWYAPNGRTWRNSSTDNICKAEPIAWMNLPTPSQSKGE